MTTLIAQESWTRQWLSADTDRPGELRWQWMNLPESWGVFVWLLIFALVIGAAFWLYRRESQVCPLPIRMTLAGLRVAVLVFLLLLLFKPSVYFQEVTIIRPTFATLRDRSLSMDRADTYQDEGQFKRLAEVSGVNEEELRNRKINRADLVNRTLNRDQFAALNQLREKGSLQLIDFDDRLDPLELLADRQSISAETNDGSANESADPLDVTPLRAVGVGTDIWLALRQTLSEVKRLGAIILISDGQHKGSENPLEMAKRAAELNVPIYTIGVGDPTPERNVAVTEVNVPARAYLNEPFFIESVLQTSFSPDDPARQLPIEVQLYQQLIDPRTGRPGDAQLIDTQQTTLPDSGNRLRLQFSRVADQVSKYVYSIRVPEIEGETTTEDNRKTSAVTEVVDEKIRVLVISGLPNWDYQQLSRLLMRDGTILVSCWLQSLDETRLQEGDEIIVALPRTMEELGQYNAVIMIDPNPEEFDEAWMKLLQDFCRNKAGGLVYMAGPHFSGEFLSMNRLAGFRELLPVRFADANTIAASQVIAEATGESSGSMQIVGFNLEHDVMKLAKDPEDVQRTWNQMPGFLWNFPTLAAKPTARVLIERGDQPSSEGNQPMLVDGKFGAGTVLYFGFQGTWRWRSVGLQAQYFNSFWIQTVRYLVEHRSLQGNRRGFLDADQVEYELGSRITLLGDLVDEQFRPLQAESANVVIKDEEGRTQRLTLKQVPGKTGKFTGTLNAARIGNFEATFEVANAEPNQLEPATFRVTPPRAEVAATWLNERLLRDLAEQSGGAYFHLSEFDKLAAALPELETRAEFNSPPQPAWDLNRWLRGLAFLLPVLLLTIEWAIRKWYKLL
ncbi:MAG: VWA domain-containing protein [Pirellulaceae bacterium]|nr:VWA domain-containing protein [Pirellulaceae bacterium]